jgi:hypothetical protein
LLGKIIVAKDEISARLRTQPMLLCSITSNLPLCAKVELRLSFENLAKKTFFQKATSKKIL